jgi:hypothetical protein
MNLIEPHFFQSPSTAKLRLIDRAHFAARVTHNLLKSPDSREKNRVKIVSRACPKLRNTRRGRVLTLHQ